MANTRNHTFSPSKYLTRTDNELRAARRERERAVAKWDQIIEGLEAARNAMSAHVLNHVATTNGSGPQAGSLTAVVQEILEAHAEPVTMDVILGDLQKRRIPMDRPSAANKLQYLKKKGLAKNPEHGKWTAATSIAA